MNGSIGVGRNQVSPEFLARLNGKSEPAQDKSAALAHYSGQLATTDERMVQLITLFGRCDERGKKTILAIAGVQASFVLEGL